MRPISSIGNPDNDTNIQTTTFDCFYLGFIFMLGKKSFLTKESWYQSVIRLFQSLSASNWNIVRLGSALNMYYEEGGPPVYRVLLVILERKEVSDAGTGHRSTELGSAQTADCSQDCSLDCSSAACRPLAGSGGGGHRHHVTRFNDLLCNNPQTSRVIIHYQQTSDQTMMEQKIVFT